MNLPALITALACASIIGLPRHCAAAAGQTVYENNFDKVEAGKVPEDFLVIDGGFAVKEEAGNKVLELPGAPLDTFGALFGPTEPANLCVSARMFGTAKGRSFPTFGVGLNGVGGYRLQISPGKGKLEIYKGDAAMAFIPYKWASGAWVHLKVQSRKTAEGMVKVEGRVWKQGEAEPKDWVVTFEDKQDPPAAGRPAIWGSPMPPHRSNTMTLWWRKPIDNLRIPQVCYIRKGNDTETLDFRDPNNPLKTVGAPATSAFPPGIGSASPILFGQTTR